LAQSTDVIFKYRIIKNRVYTDKDVAQNMVNGLMVATQGTIDRNASPTLPLFDALHKITAIKYPICVTGKKRNIPKPTIRYDKTVLFCLF